MNIFQRFLSMITLFLFSAAASQAQGLPATLSSNEAVGFALKARLPQSATIIPIDSLMDNGQLKKVLIFYKVQYVYRALLPEQENGWPVKYVAFSVNDSAKLVAMHFVVEDKDTLLDYLVGRYGKYDLVTGTGNKGDNSYYWYKNHCLFYLKQDLSGREGRPKGMENIDRVAIITFSNCDTKEFIFDPISSY